MTPVLDRFQSLHAVDSAAIAAYFIRHILPRGLAGLVVAALFSAAMSSLDSGMNSISSVVVTDFYRRFRSAIPTPRQELFLARVVTAAVGGLATAICLLLYQIPEEQRGNLFDIQGRVTSFLVGSLRGLMLIAMLGIRCSARVAMGSALCGILVGFLWAQGQWSGRSGIDVDVNQPCSSVAT